MCFEEMLLGAFNHVFTWSKISEIGEINERKRFADFELYRNGLRCIYVLWDGFNPRDKLRLVKLRFIR